ncbi:MAG TPA: hypothetical protein VGS41_12885, partial [Chthonomonadales bacterium]|nr:hypothetical protein [Chthonomonadales bacterium]
FALPLSCDCAGRPHARLHAVFSQLTGTRLPGGQERFLRLRRLPTYSAAWQPPGAAAQVQQASGRLCAPFYRARLMNVKPGAGKQRYHAVVAGFLDA